MKDVCQTCNLQTKAIPQKVKQVRVLDFSTHGDSVGDNVGENVGDNDLKVDRENVYV